MDCQKRGNLTARFRACGRGGAAGRATHFSHFRSYEQRVFERPTVLWHSNFWKPARPTLSSRVVGTFLFGPSNTIS